MTVNDGGAITSLVETIDTQLKRVHTQSLDLSFNEMLDMKKNGELNITPEYQRLFQWSEGSRSRFIESLLLEMPVPPIYVIEDDDGRYLLIDGLQRISSYLHFRGELDAPHLDPPVQPGNLLELQECDIIRALNGHTFETLGVALQIRLKRAFVRVEVVRKGSDSRFKYHMFKRLNTGGEKLSEQQVRNCTIRLLDPKFNDFVIDLSGTEDFSLCTAAITYDQRLRAFDQELVLRFFAFKNWRNRFKHDVADFLTDYMEVVSDETRQEPFDYDVERTDFLKTFKILNLTMQDLAFAAYSQRFGKVVKGFSVYNFEAFTIGIQPFLPRIEPNDNGLIARLTAIFYNIKRDGAFQNIIRGGGKNSPGPLNERISFVTEALRREL